MVYGGSGGRARHLRPGRRSSLRWWCTRRSARRASPAPRPGSSSSCRLKKARMPWSVARLEDGVVVAGRSGAEPQALRCRWQDRRPRLSHAKLTAATCCRARRGAATAVIRGAGDTGRLLRRSRSVLVSRDCRRRSRSSSRTPAAALGGQSPLPRLPESVGQDSLAFESTRLVVIVTRGHVAVHDMDVFQQAPRTPLATAGLDGEPRKRARTVAALRDGGALATRRAGTTGRGGDGER